MVTQREIECVNNLLNECVHSHNGQVEYDFGKAQQIIANHVEQETKALREAAQEVINRWDSPHWKWDDEHTGHKINRLRAALANTTKESKTDE